VFARLIGPTLTLTAAGVDEARATEASDCKFSGA